jgi:NTP pyrophosphatase (non-canonical NTP hydrolase)
MTGNEYQKLAARTIGKNMCPSDQEGHALHGMVSEIGELHGIYQKLSQGHDFDLYHAMSELGDLLWFIAEYCTAFGWELEEVMQFNIDKLKKRYPEGFDTEKSLHRADGDI